MHPRIVVSLVSALGVLLLGACGGGGTSAADPIESGTGLAMDGSVTVTGMQGRYLDAGQDVTVNAFGGVAGSLGPQCRISGNLAAHTASTESYVLSATIEGSACPVLGWAPAFAPATYVFRAKQPAPGVHEVEFTTSDSASGAVRLLRLGGWQPLAAEDTFKFVIRHDPGSTAGAYLAVAPPNVPGGSRTIATLPVWKVEFHAFLYATQVLTSPTSEDKYDPKLVYTFLLPAVPAGVCGPAEVRVQDTQGIMISVPFQLCAGVPLTAAVERVVTAPG
jgi:hypothetical protein